MEECIELNDEKLSYDDGIQVVIGYGTYGPTEFIVGDYVSGRYSKEDSDVLIALLRDVADAIELESKVTSH